MKVDIKNTAWIKKTRLSKYTKQKLKQSETKRKFILVQDEILQFFRFFWVQKKSRTCGLMRQYVSESYNITQCICF